MNKFFSWNLQKNLQNRDWGVVQVVERLPSKCKALSLNPNIAKINQTNNFYNIFK
jgi:hypothetical protein